MSREVHVRFCEGLGLKCPGLLTLAMTGPWVPADELSASPNDMSGALERYEQRCRPMVEETRRPAARWLAGALPPALRLAVRNAGLRVASWPGGWRILRQAANVQRDPPASIPRSA